jgi:hypothetical protein
MQAVGEKTYVEAASPFVIYRDQWTRRDPPLVYVQPKDVLNALPPALFVPFRVTQPMRDPEIVGYTEARKVWQTWLAMQLFPTLEFAADAGPYRRDRALALARAKGADIVVGGFVTRYYPGGTAGSSEVALQVEIHDSRSGELIWSMAQSALMPASENNDFLLFSTRTRLPSDPMFVLTKVMAQDMGAVIHRSVQPGASSAQGPAGTDRDAPRESGRDADRGNPPVLRGETQARPAF